MMNGEDYDGGVDASAIDEKCDQMADGDGRKGMKWCGVNNRACVWNRTIEGGMEGITIITN